LLCISIEDTPSIKSNQKQFLRMWWGCTFIYSDVWVDIIQWPSLYWFPLVFLSDLSCYRFVSGLLSSIFSHQLLTLIEPSSWRWKRAMKGFFFRSMRPDMWTHFSLRDCLMILIMISILSLLLSFICIQRR